ncbi:MAG: DNA polymerase III subunit delta [Clostridiales bacterium]|nr:DNA polymerase III subunit delta [Clostridiales bacterium]
MNHKELHESLKRGEIARCYLFEGEEEFTKQAALKNLRKAAVSGDFAPMNETRLIDPAPDALIAAAETLPFLSDKRWIEIRDCAMLQAGKAKEYDEDAAVKRLTEYFDHLPDTACIVFYVRGKADGRKKFYQLLKKKAVIVSFDPLNDEELAKWVARQLKLAGKKISMHTCQQLWFSAGREMTMLNNEIEKLIAYTGDREEITDGDIREVCVKSTEFKVFDLADTLLSGNGSKALEMLEGLLREGEERMMLLSLLGRQCRQMRDARALAAAGARPGEIAGKIGVPPFAVGRILETARGYTVEKLNRIARLCLDREYQVKSGQMMDAGALESAMLGILAIRRE